MELELKKKVVKNQLTIVDQFLSLRKTNCDLLGIIIHGSKSCCRWSRELLSCTSLTPLRTPFLHDFIHKHLKDQKNLHQMKMIMKSPSPPIGPYCFNISSQLILTAALRYFLLSSLNLLLTSPIRSRLSPL